jgi:iron complex outermembrane receptor protein
MANNLPIRSSLALLLIGLTAPLCSQDKAKVADADMEALLELLNTPVKSASKVAQRPMDAPSIISPISQDQLRIYGWDSINDVLFAQPGFSPSQDYDRRTVSARGQFEGWNNNHLLMLVDGVPMNDNLYGSAYTWEITPIFMAKSLEVLRGPGSALYGSNATNGVVAINTLSAEEIAKPGQARIRLGSRQGRQVDFVVGSVSDTFSLTAAYARYSTNGDEYADFDGSGRTDSGGRLAQFQTWDRRSNDYFLGKLEGRGSLNGLTLQYHHQGWQFGTGHGWIFLTPDFAETMKEGRDILVGAYRTDSAAWSQEYVVRYQRHTIDWNQRYYPNDPNVYPAGMWEYLDTHADEIFGRAQGSYTFGKGGSLVFGLEATRFSYNGDREHTSNIDLEYYDSQGNPNPNAYLPWDSDNSTQRLRPWLEFTANHPVLKTGLYAQYSSGKLFNDHFSATLGVRYDKQQSDFTGIDLPGRPTESLDFSRVSPRVAFIYHGGDSFSLKLLAGQAFRTPAPTELFGANTYSLASNTRGLKPEIIDTLELASDWTISHQISWKVNVFKTKFKNQIAYSPTNYNLSTNLYTLTTQGLETELQFGVGALRGFFNGSYAKRVDEESQDPFIIPKTDETTWAPAVTFNLGLSYKSGPWSIGFTAHRQGEVKRRDSDLPEVGTAFEGYRPSTVGAWTSLDLRVGLKVGNGLEVEFGAKNASDQQGTLLKNFNFPFDYRIEPRTVYMGIRLY